MECRELPQISVCIPTYKRPRLLHKCLEMLQNQKADGFSYSIVVVDNDAEHSARVVVEQWQKRLEVDLEYDIEPVQNISLARNRAIAMSRGDLIAFVDDDELPAPRWLFELHSTCMRFSVDGVLGPVLPYFEGSPPGWLVKSGLCIRSSFTTGTIMSDPKYMRTGNVLFRRDIFAGTEAPFDPARGCTGGEDTALFAKLLRHGCLFVWSNEACVYEAVPPERQRRSYYLRRALSRGLTAAEIEPALSLGTVKSILAVAFYSASLPFLLLLGQHMFMKFLVKDFDHLGKLFAHLGIGLVKTRT